MKDLLPISNAEQFDKGLNALGMQLAASHVTYKLFKDVRHSFKEFQREVNQSQAFWGITADALRDVSVLGLCRVFDPHKSTNSLPNLLRKIEATPNFAEIIRKVEVEGADDAYLPPHDVVVDTTQLQADVVFCSRQNPSVRKLLHWREHVLAHQNWALVVNSKKNAHVPTYGDFDRLFEGGLKVLNRYLGLFRKAEWASFMPDIEGYTFVFQSLRENLNLIRAKQDEEMRKYGFDPDKYRAALGI